MAYKLDLDRSIALDVRERASEQLSKAKDDLTDEGMTRAEAVHEARKRLKKLRGLLRLVRPALGTAYKLENATLRDCGHQLGGARDADAMRECIDDLIARHDDDLGREAGAFDQAVKAWRQKAQPTDRTLERKVAAVVRTLEKTERRLEHWPLPGDDRRPLLDGLEKSYKRGRKAMRKAYGDPTGERFHEWRKRVKYHLYHLRLLRNVWTGPMRARADETKALSDLLGDDHDLTVLRGLIEQEELVLDKPEARATLLGLIERDQTDFRARARVLGARLFAEKPRDLRARIGAYWAAEPAISD